MVPFAHEVNSNIHFSKFDTDFDGRIVYDDFTLNNIPYRVINIYSPPLIQIKNEVFKTLYPLLTGKHNTILAGDFNSFKSQFRSNW